ncbi:MAG: selenium-dependent molybdenum cofactor biosynthesis protein YqeB [Thermoanaerobacteraceae bacterium]|nr:selenium-dependent molybdenum cofactor biosynthesis protein YqeB [Thermoanaerobacteraceae bacterium]
MPLVIVRGGGDLGTGIAHRLKRCGFDVIVLEIEKPLSVRRMVSFSEAVYMGHIVVEGIKAIRVDDCEEGLKSAKSDYVPVIVDETAKSIYAIKPDVVVDARMLKQKNDTNIHMAPVVVGCGPGFEAGVDAHAVVETMRGHDLGKVILQGSAMPNTGKPGMIGGRTGERVLYAPVDGRVDVMMDIGNFVYRDDLIARIGSEKIRAQIDGIVRGMIHPGAYVKKGTKIGDIDPRMNVGYCYTISDKSRAVAGGVVEAILYLGRFLMKG